VKRPSAGIEGAAERGGARGKQEIAVRRVLRFCLWGLIVVVASGGALFGYFVYSPSPEVPRLSGTLNKGTIEVGALRRTYRIYVQQGLTKGAPLVVMMHGSGENSAQMRIATGYGFERLVDERGFAVVYPEGYEGYWNACNIVGDYSANKLNIDDVGFLTGMVHKLISEIGVDPGRVFATGISRGGHMAFRLALEAPSLSCSRGGSGKRADAGELQMQARGARHCLRHDHERYPGSLEPVRWWRGQFFRLLRAWQGPVVARVRSIFCGPQQHHRHA
jgi:predicted esterase